MWVTLLAIFTNFYQCGNQLIKLLISKLLLFKEKKLGQCVVGWVDIGLGHKASGDL
jgi:hypothetical protein